MIGRYVLSLLALIGLAVATGAVMESSQSAPIAPPAVRSPKVPFASYMAGAGMIEASTENIAIGTAVSGIVTAIYVKLGDRVKAGAPLFRIDDRDLQGRLLVAVAKVKEAEEILAKKTSILDFSTRLAAGIGFTKLEIKTRQLDVAIDEATLALAKADVDQIKIEIERRTIRAPVAGSVLQIKTRLGEFAQGGVLITPLMLFGDTDRLHVRVDIDENDAWRVQPGGSARAFVRGNPELNTSLRFERFEPYILPKTSLTGQSTERTDTRVLQVIYSFDPSAAPVFVGQQVDVFIEAPPIGKARAQTDASREMR